jgi:hypothetical protein
VSKQGGFTSGRRKGLIGPLPGRIVPETGAAALAPQRILPPRKCSARSRKAIGNFRWHLCKIRIPGRVGEYGNQFMGTAFIEMSLSNHGFMMTEAPADTPDTLERGTGEAVRNEPLPPALLPGWRAIPHAIVRARGEEGYIDLVALHPQKGVALLAFLEKDEVADTEAAREAFTEMLREAEFAQQFPGSLPIVALALTAPADDLDRWLERAFAAERAPALSPEWVEWLEARLTPAPPPTIEPPPRLAAPLRDDDAPPPSIGVLLVAPSRAGEEKVGEAVSVEAPEQAPPPCAMEPPRWTDWGISLGVASGIVLALLTVLALFSRTGRLF